MSSCSLSLSLCVCGDMHYLSTSNNKMQVMRSSTRERLFSTGCQPSIIEQTIAKSLVVTPHVEQLHSYSNWIRHNSGPHMSPAVGRHLSSPIALHKRRNLFSETECPPEHAKQSKGSGDPWCLHSSSEINHPEKRVQLLQGQPPAPLPPAPFPPAMQYLGTQPQWVLVLEAWPVFIAHFWGPRMQQGHSH